MLRSILGRVLALSTARQSPVDLLLFLEVPACCSSCFSVLLMLTCLLLLLGLPLIHHCLHTDPGKSCRYSAAAWVQVWHAVLTYLDAFEAELWEAGDDLQARERVKQAAAAYKGARWAAVVLLLCWIPTLHKHMAP